MDENFVAFSYAMTMDTKKLEQIFYETCERLLYEMPGNSDVLSLSNIFNAYVRKIAAEQVKLLDSYYNQADRFDKVIRAVRKFYLELDEYVDCE